MKQLFKAALLIFIIVFLSVTESTAQDKITLKGGASISGDIVSIDTTGIKLKYYPQIDKVTVIIRLVEANNIKKVRYNNFEYNLDKTNIKYLIDLFNKKENKKDSKSILITKDQSLVV